MKHRQDIKDNSGNLLVPCHVIHTTQNQLLYYANLLNLLKSSLMIPTTFTEFPLESENSQHLTDITSITTLLVTGMIHNSGIGNI